MGKIASKLGWQNEENTHVVLDAIGIHKLVGENYENSSQVKFDAGDDIKNRRRVLDIDNLSFYLV